MRVAAATPSRAGHDAARRILTHSHFKVLYERNPQDAKVNFDPGRAIAEAAQLEFGSGFIRYNKPRLTSGVPDFPVSTRDQRIEAAISVSEMLSKLQPTSIDYVFIHPDLRDKAKVWLDRNRDKVLTAAQGQEDEQHERQPKNSAVDTTRP